MIGTICGGLMVLFLVWFVWKAVHAPYGYEDETGFHYGSKKF
jgi:hypothetical protein